MLDHRTLTSLEQVLPGPVLAALLAQAAAHPGSDAAELLGPRADPVDRMVAWQRMACWVDAGLNDAILAIAGSAAPQPEAEDWGREEVAAGLSWSAGHAGDRIELARTLAQRLRATRTALSQGRITLRHAGAIAKALDPLDDKDAIHRAEKAILGKAAGRTVAQLGRVARREAMKHDPRGADQRHRAVRKQRRVEFTALPDGMSELRAYLPADAATRLRSAIDQLAGRTRAKGDDRTIDQRRADALVGLAEFTTASRPASTTAAGDVGASDGEVPKPAARPSTPPRIAVIAPLSTITGEAEIPGELVGYGPVPPVIIRQLAGTEQTRWEKWITDPGGIVTDLGRTSYRPSAALAALVRAGNPTCVFPGCGQPSYRCDLDHVTRWIDGGTTELANLVPLCRRHHRAKDEAGWQLLRASNGTCHWTSPAGHTYEVEPHRYDTTPDSDASAQPESGEDWDSPLASGPSHPGGGGATAPDDPPF